MPASLSSGQRRSHRKQEGHIPRGELNVVVRRDDVNVELAFGRCQENALADANLLGSRAKELTEKTVDARSLTRTWRAVEEHVRDISYSREPLEALR